MPPERMANPALLGEMSAAHHAPHGHGHGPGHDLHGPHVHSWWNVSLAVILGVAAIVAGITAWRGTVLNGHAVENFTLSTQSTNNANTMAQDAERSINTQRTLYLEYAQARDAKDAKRAAMAYSMMDSGTRSAIEWWDQQAAGNRPPSPFSAANPEWPAPSSIIDARLTLDESAAQLELANAELAKSHTLELLAALLTITFLAGGLSGVFESQNAKRALVAASGGTLVVCLIALVFMW